MIEFTQGNLLKAEVDALVNTVNTEGFMGKGIALQFKKAFPDNFEAYAAACRQGQVTTGSMFTVPVNLVHSRVKYIINFPTKGKWRAKSRIEYIRDGLQSLVADIKRLGIRSVAIPPLGCGLGGLAWPEVRALIEDAFRDMDDVRILVFVPGKTPAAEDMVNNSPKPPLNALSAVFLRLFDRYMAHSFSTALSMVEMQKLTYFLVLAKLPLRIQFSKGPYGPYSDGLRHLLCNFDGHYISGYGDGTGSPLESIVEVTADRKEINSFLTKAPSQAACLDTALKYISGFESTYGLELLSSVHWAADKEIGKADPAEVTRFVQHWTKRKKQLFTDKHIRIAFEHLHRHGLLPH